MMPMDGGTFAAKCQNIALKNITMARRRPQAQYIMKQKKRQFLQEQQELQQKLRNNFDSSSEEGSEEEEENEGKCTKSWENSRISFALYLSRTVETPPWKRHDRGVSSFRFFAVLHDFQRVDLPLFHW